MGRYRSPPRNRQHSGSWKSPSGRTRYKSGGDDRSSRRHTYSSSRSRSRSNSHSRSRSRSHSRESFGDEQGYRLHIADLSMECSRKDLELCFQKFGPLVEVWLARSPQCFAFVVYKNKEDAKDAIREMHGKKFCGNRVRVTKARPRTRGQRTYRGYNPNLRCYECGKRGHFSRDCRLNDHTNPKNRDVKTMSIKDLINWDITDDDIIKFNESPYHSPRSRSRSSSSSRSSGSRRYSRRRSRDRSSDSSDGDNKDENANSTKNEKSETPKASSATPTSPSQPEDRRQILVGTMKSTFQPVITATSTPGFQQVQQAYSQESTRPAPADQPGTKPDAPEVRTIMMNSQASTPQDVANIAMPSSIPS